MDGGHNQLLQLLDSYFKVRNVSFLNGWTWTKHGLENMSGKLNDAVLCMFCHSLLPCGA